VNVEATANRRHIRTLLFWSDIFCEEIQPQSWKSDSTAQEDKLNKRETDTTLFKIKTSSSFSARECKVAALKC